MKKQKERIETEVLLKNSISQLNKRVNDKVKALLDQTCKKYVPRKPEVIKYTLTASTQEF